MLEKSLFVLVFALLFMGLAVWSQHVKTSSDVAYASSIVPERTFDNSVQDPYSCPGISPGTSSCSGSSALPLEIEVIQSPSH